MSRCLQRHTVFAIQLIILELDKSSLRLTPCTLQDQRQTSRFKSQEKILILGELASTSKQAILLLYYLLWYMRSITFVLEEMRKQEKATTVIWLINIMIWQPAFTSMAGENLFTLLTDGKVNH
ncbi:uncharacterized protein LOC109703825 isoform X1 [Ananas comosus]|uniref:Uncharacterized protein LOC109703825 isoform X1 n=1 Tax=Ananas comosus TaxID=4615 RepID=A0A6P5EAC3_ANACO|nr:uncharacterized protein LOC109703825 isoform X1 [Ananas comosus]